MTRCDSVHNAAAEILAATTQDEVQRAANAATVAALQERWTASDVEYVRAISKQRQEEIGV